MPTYTYRCQSCGTRVELPAPPDGERRHLLGDEVCGTLRRDYRADAVATLTYNLKEARR